MNITFEDKALEELYLSGRTGAKKYARLPLDVVKRYVKTVNYIKAASRIEDLFTVGSLHYEKKSGTMNGVKAVWSNAQYRLLFHSSPNEGGIIVNALLEEISKHYEK
ncbi:MAG: type II toxin-antitoxin system RelE/ParE family toxin [Bacteroidales bacterium]|nr:type II toxin-antitoxin system RelE/ParE family toxin [Bacteroidales bacterium]